MSFVLLVLPYHHHHAPQLPVLVDGQDMEVLIHAYTRIMRDSDGHLMDRGHTQWDALRRLLTLLAQQETELLANADATQAHSVLSAHQRASLPRTGCQR